MTKNGKDGKQKKKVNRRNKSKYPALNKGLNTGARKDYIESDYVNGVINDKGELVIRPMNEEEKAFLNQYYEEAVVTNFLHNPELKRLNDKKNKIIVDDNVKELQQRLRELRQKPEKNKKKIENLKEIIRITKKSNEDLYEEELKEIKKEMKEIEEEVLLFTEAQERKELYSENNARNRCLFNKKKSQYLLQYLDMHDYDTFQEFELNVDDAEIQLIDKLEREYYEQEEERLKAVMKEEKRLKKLAKSTKNTDNQSDES